MRRLFLLIIFLAASLLAANAQVKRKTTAAALLVTSSRFKLLTTKVAYQGETCSPSNKADKIHSDSTGAIKFGDKIYYNSGQFYNFGHGDGFVIENFAAQTCRIYKISGLAETGNWYKTNEGDKDVPDSIRGLFRVGNALWMGSNGIGVAVFDLERETWSRFDLKNSVIGGDHVSVNFADSDYAFVTRGEFLGASLHIYSVKQNKWLGLKAVSTKLVREYGNNFGPMPAQIPVDHKIFAKEQYMPIDWTFMGLKVTDLEQENSYLFVNKMSADSQTVFAISKSDLGKVFQKKL